MPDDPREVTLVVSPILGPLMRYAERLRFPQLFLLTGFLFLLDLIVPDLLPFADEVLLGLLTLLFASWRRRGRGGDRDADITVEASREPRGENGSVARRAS